MEREEPPGTERQIPSLSRALGTLRGEALRAPGAWHASPTRRYGIRVAWRVEQDSRAEAVRVERELVRPYSEDLIAVARRLPAPVEIAEVEVRGPERTLILRLRPRSPKDQAGRTACGRCQRPLRPLFGAAGLCAVCAAAPRTA